MERSSSSSSSSSSTGMSGITGITGNTGSGRAAPPGGGRRALLPALCLLLALAPLPPGRALPTPNLALPSPQALNRSRELLQAAHASLRRLKELNTLGFECTLEEVHLEDITKNQINTIKACTAEDAGAGNCPALERSAFDKSKCLQGIYEDLRAYRRELNNLPDHQVLASLDEMMKVSIFCLLPSLRDLKIRENTEALNGGWDIPERRVGAAPESFREALRLCRILQALHVRSVTISRMISFLSSL
ncbi:interleukin-12 subunit alpha [Empidonax traillii]|uniref:interleukin-12 subunit alpha n=1 Tax=Empidonax traillii TaxID=164674 RepID=UPI000FFD283F|nr:interleukin-12 subunit alpha [Empidonax traillii]